MFCMFSEKKNYHVSLSLWIGSTKEITCSAPACCWTTIISIISIITLIQMIIDQLIDQSIDWYCLKDWKNNTNGPTNFHVKCALVYNPKIWYIIMQWWASLPNLSELQDISWIPGVGSILVPSLTISIGCTGRSGRIFPFTV